MPNLPQSVNGSVAPQIGKFCQNCSILAVDFTSQRQQYV